MVGGAARRRTTKRDERPGATWPWAASIAAIGAIAYATSLSGPFLADDLATIVNNTSIRHLSELRSVLSPAAELPTAGRPIVNLTFALNYAIGGLDVHGYHLVNVFVHICCALLVFGIVRRTLDLPGVGTTFGWPTGPVAFATAAIWMLHPLNTEAVDYVTQRTESLMALFYLTTVYASIRALGRRGVSTWHLLAVAACALGMASKESMITAPFIVIAYDWAFRRSDATAGRPMRWRFYAALASTWFVLASLLVSAPRPYSVGLSNGIGPATYLLNQTLMITRYLRLAVWPQSLVLYYGWARLVSLHEVLPQVFATGALVACSAMTFVLKPMWGFPAVWFFATLAPTSSVVPIVTEVGAERRMYLPLVGLVALVVVGGAFACSRFSRRSHPDAARFRRVAALAFAAVLASVALSYGVLVMRRHQDYASAVAMARSVVARWPTSAGHYFLGVALADAGDHDEAIEQLRLATPEDPRARYALGRELFLAGKLDESADQLGRFVNEQPRLPEAGRSARLMIGQALVRERRWQEAAGEFERVLGQHPGDADATRALLDALENQAIALASSGRQPEAVDLFRRAAGLDPDNAQARNNLVVALLGVNRLDEALDEARTSVRLHPQDAVAHALLGRSLAASGSSAEAVVEFERSLQIDPADAEARRDLAAVRRK